MKTLNKYFDFKEDARRKKECNESENGELRVHGKGKLNDPDRNRRAAWFAGLSRR
jgi:hypothetical protein